jgi:hypothetical protein
MFSQAFRPGLNCAAPRRRSRDAEGAPTELIAVAEVALLFGWRRQEARTPSRGAPSILVCCCVLLGAQAGMPVLLKGECAERFKDAGPGRLCC